MLSCTVNVTLQPARIPRTSQSALASLAVPLYLSSPGSSSRLEDSSPSCGLSTVDCDFSPRGSAPPLGNKAFSNCPVLTLLHTSAPVTPLFSHSSLKHPGVAWASSNPFPLCGLRTPLHAQCENAPTLGPLHSASRGATIRSWAGSRLNAVFASADFWRTRPVRVEPPRARKHSSAPRCLIE